MVMLLPLDRPTFPADFSKTPLPEVAEVVILPPTVMLVAVSEIASVVEMPFAFTVKPCALVKLSALTLLACRLVT